MPPICLQLNSIVYLGTGSRGEIVPSCLVRDALTTVEVSEQLQMCEEERHIYLAIHVLPACKTTVRNSSRRRACYENYVPNNEWTVVLDCEGPSSGTTSVCERNCG